MDKDRQRRRNAKRLALAIERRGGQWALLNDGRFCLLNFWLPCRLKKRVRQLEPQILALLREGAALQAKESKLLLMEAESRSEPQPRALVN